MKCFILMPSVQNEKFFFVDHIISINHFVLFLRVLKKYIIIQFAIKKYFRLTKLKLLKQSSTSVNVYDVKTFNNESSKNNDENI